MCFDAIWKGDSLRVKNVIEIHSFLEITVYYRRFT